MSSRQTISRGVKSRFGCPVRRAGWTAANSAGLVIAVFLASASGFWFNQCDLALLTTTLLGAILVTVGVGYVSVEI